MDRYVIDSKENITFEYVKSQLKLDEKYIISDLSNELEREYLFVQTPVNMNNPYRIYNPVALIMRKDGSTHRIVDSKGSTHCVPYGKDVPVVLKWTDRNICSF